MLGKAFTVGTHGALVHEIGPGRIRPELRRSHLGLLRHGRHELLRIAARETDDAFADTDVGIQNLTGERVNRRGADGEGRIDARKPADRRVARVTRIPFGIVGLLLHDHGILEADALEGLVPHQRAFLDPLAVFLGNRVLEVEDDRLLGNRERLVGVGLLQIPARVR